MPRVDARAIATIPAQRSGPNAVLQRGDSPVDVLALLGGVEFVVLLPAPAMAAHIIAGLGNGLGCRGITLERQRTTKNRQGQMPLLKQPDDAPEANTAAIFVHRF